MSTQKRIEEVLHRSLSLTALAYVITYTWIPYFLLATTPWTSNILIAMVRLVHPFRKPRPDPTAPFTPTMSPGPILYTILGTAFSILTLILLTESLFKPRKQIMKKTLAKLAERNTPKTNIFWLNRVPLYVTESITEWVIKMDAQTKVLQKGKITIPAKIRERLGISEGDYLRLKIVGNKLVLFPPKTVPNPTELLSGLAEGVPIREPVKQELRKASAARVEKKLSRTVNYP